MWLVCGWVTLVSESKRCCDGVVLGDVDTETDKNDDSSSFNTKKVLIDK